MRLLITGGCGFVGSNLIRFILHARPGWSVVNLDALRYSANPANLADLRNEPRYRFVRGDVADRAVVEPLIGEVDAVIHAAAESHVDRSIIDSQPFIHSNVVGTQALLDALRAVGGDRRLVHVSTDEVYGSLPLDRPDLRFSESAPLAPNSPYAASKAASDCLVRAACHTFGLDALITRCSNNFGPFQFPEKIIPLFVTNLIDGLPVPLYGDGLHVRDWLHVEDHAEALLAVLERGRGGEVYNIGADNERSNLDLTHALLDCMDLDASMIEHVPDRLGHDRRYAIDAERMADQVGWRPSRSAWPRALERTVRWYRDHERWWRPLKERAALR